LAISHFAKSFNSEVGYIIPESLRNKANLVLINSQKNVEQLIVAQRNVQLNVGILEASQQSINSNVFLTKIYNNLVPTELSLKLLAFSFIGLGLAAIYIKKPDQSSANDLELSKVSSNTISEKPPVLNILNLDIFQKFEILLNVK